MKFHCHLRKAASTGRSFVLFIVYFFCISPLLAQETNSRASGKIFSDNNEPVAGATVIIIHEPTQNKYADVTRNDGYFHFFNLKPGGPYSILITSAGFDSLLKTNLFARLTGENFFLDDDEVPGFFLHRKTVLLSEITINANNSNKTKAGIETSINEMMLRSMPTISRNFQDFVRLVPQAKVNGEGVMSLAGQNNRFNAFFIDGANNTDIRGISVNGMNGGQTGSPPISIEAIEEINILQSPYNVQYGNFTGGSINTITRSGSNQNKSSIWYYFRNEDLAGRSPEPLEKPGSPGEVYRPRLSKFYNQTFGAWNSGAFIKDKLFYFFLLEKQSDERPQPFNMLDYRGSSNQQQLSDLSNFIQNTYHYDPGSFLETKDNLEATRLNVKLDWNASLKDKFMLSYRYNNAERMTAPRPSSANAISFHNNGIILPATTHSASLEWKRFLKSNVNNRLLLTFTDQEDHRKWIGKPFPSVTIVDGNGTLTFGSETGTGINYFKAADLGLLNVLTYVRKKNIYTFGADVNYTSIVQRAIPGFFGAYRFRNVNDFMTSAAPSQFTRTFYLSENSYPEFRTLRNSFFANDEIRLRTNLKINFGVRLDVNSIPSRPATDRFFNDSAISVISKYYDLENARSGSAISAHWNLSPRFGFDYKLLKYGINLKGGAGIFLGHIVNAWVFDVFNSNTRNIDIVVQQFNPDPYGQPTPESLNIDPSNLKGTLCLMAKNFKYPSVFRTTFSVEKKTRSNWVFSIQGIFTKNIQEMGFKNVNILSPVLRSAAPGSRNIYSVNAMPNKIPLKSNGTNPYAQVMLLTNNHGKKGYAYSLTFLIQKQVKGFSLNGSYTYGRSNLLFEITGPQTPIASQWRNMETVNGRNFTTLSTSDNSLKHRVTAWISKQINYPKQKTSTTISLFYNGQSGSPYSYVYNRSMINDNGKNLENFDLIYIPTINDLSSMKFVPITNTNGDVLYTAEQQKSFLNTFIESDKYLKKRRGEFAERNGARLPFTHIIDLRLQQDFTIKTKKKNIGISIIYDVFNFTNMLNKKWGHTWFLTNDSYPLIRFSDYANTTTLTPQYQFTPFTGKPYSLQTSTQPGNSPRWISQLGIKINLN